MSARAEFSQSGKLDTVIIQRKVFRKLSAAITWKENQMLIEIIAQRAKVKNNSGCWYVSVDSLLLSAKYSRPI